MTTMRKTAARAAKRGFTLLELMLVIAIIAVLSAIAINTWMNAIRDTRAKKAIAARRTLTNAVMTFKVENGEYPPEIQSLVDKGGTGKKYLSQSQTKKVIDKVVEATEKGHTMMDVTGLYVKTSGGDVVEYNEARREKMSVSAWGYTTPDGSFRSLFLGYNPISDQVFFYYKVGSDNSGDDVEYEKKDKNLLLLDRNGNEISTDADAEDLIE